MNTECTSMIDTSMIDEAVVEQEHDKRVCKSMHELSSVKAAAAADSFKKGTFISPLVQRREELAVQRRLHEARQNLHLLKDRH